MRNRLFVAASVLIGIIVIAAALGLAYYNFGPGGKSQEASTADDSKDAYGREEDLRDSYTRMEAEVDFESVATWALECMHASGFENLPIRDKILLSYYAPTRGGEGDLPNGVKKLSEEQHAIVVLNRNISFARENFRLQASDAGRWLMILTFTSIFVGMITTIFVSVSSSEFGRGDGRPQRWIRCCAVVLPIVGTAVAALSAFYSPQAKLSQAVRSLAGLSQVHAQMAFGVWALKCEGDDRIAKFISDWSGRYIDIETVAIAAGAPPEGGGGIKQ